MRQLAVMIILMMLAGCGSTYHLRTGGWKLSKIDGEGTCLVVHGDGDPEVTRVCIASPENLKISKAVAEELCRGAE
tara:strand:+ start:288 stop:515 length:228 start_codon:yes stop_codon:yes gene_type:complete